MVVGRVADKETGVGGLHSDAVKGGRAARGEGASADIPGIDHATGVSAEIEEAQAIEIGDGLSAIGEREGNGGDVNPAAHHIHVGRQGCSQGDRAGDLALANAPTAGVTSKEARERVPCIGVGGVRLRSRRHEGKQQQAETQQSLCHENTSEHGNLAF